MAKANWSGHRALKLQLQPIAPSVANKRAVGNIAARHVHRHPIRMLMLDFLNLHPCRFNHASQCEFAANLTFDRLGGSGIPASQIVAGRYVWSKGLPDRGRHSVKSRRWRNSVVERNQLDLP